METNTKTDKKDFIASGKLSKVMLTLAIPSILGSIIGQVNLLIDSFYLGRFLEGDLAVTCLAATAIALPLLLIYLSVINLFAIGGSIYAAQILGTGKERDAKQIAANSFAFGLIIVLILTVLFQVFMHPFVSALGATTPELMHYTTRYTTIINLCSFTIFIMTYYVMFLRAEGRATIVLVTIAIQIIANIILNYIFIVPMNLDTAGAALGTVTSQFIQVIIFVIYAKKNKCIFNPNFKLVNFDLKQLKKIVNFGFPSTLAFLLTLVAAVVLQIQANQLGDTELKAAVGIVIKIVVMFLMLTQAAASGVQPVFAYSYGAKMKERFGEAYKIYIKSSLVVGILIGILLIIFPQGISNLFTKDQSMLTLINMATRMLGIMLFIMPMSFVVQILFQAMGQAKVAVSIVLIRQLLPFLVIALILPSFIGANATLISLQISVLIGSVIIIAFYMNKLKHAISKISE